MPELEDIEYSQDETVEVIRDYFQFLAAMYLDPARIAYPPSSGWPTITHSSFEAFGKSEEVVDLLRHLPYITGDGGNPWEDRPHAAANCKFHDYTSWSTAQSLLQNDGEKIRSATEGGFHDNVPSHVLGLLSGCEDQAFLLDTQLGILHWTEYPGEVYNGRQNLNTLLSRQLESGSATESRHDNDSRAIDYSRNINYSRVIEKVLVEFYDNDLVPEREQEWRADSRTWAVGDFFHLLKLQFLALNWIPLSDKKVVDVWSLERQGPAQMASDLRQVWREHGWPPQSTDVETGRSFDKQACLAQVRRMLKEKYPEVEKFLDQYP